MTSPAKPLGVGIIGCGNISSAYLRLAPLFAAIEVRAVADLDHRLAEARAAEFGVRAAPVAALLDAPDLDIVVNLTVPAAHFEVSAAILAAGKHVYSEKPFVLSVVEGQELAGMAASRGLRVGSAADTFLRGAHQLARRIVDEGGIGRVVGGTAYVMGHGMEHWHPNPSFFFQPGAGPVLDVGPYYVTNLIQLLGPVRRVAAISSTPARQREILSEPLKGQMIEVNTPTTIMSVLEFASGAVVNLSASWDVWAHGRAPMELYGTDGSLFVPDPNFFGGELRAAGRDGKVAVAPPPLGASFRHLQRDRRRGAARQLPRLGPRRHGRGDPHGSPAPLLALNVAPCGRCDDLDPAVKRHKFHALVLTHEPGLGRVLTILSCPGAWADGGLTLPLAAPVPIPEGPVELAVAVDHATQHFQWRSGGDWRGIGPALDASVISDEGGRGEHGSFTGAFVGMLAFDITRGGAEARFDRFAYKGG